MSATGVGITTAACVSEAEGAAAGEVAFVPDYDGNVGRLFGGIEVFEQAQPDDGLLELGLVSADGVADWARTIARTLAGSPEASPFVRTTRAQTVKIKLSRKMLYELDGGARKKTRRLKIKVRPAAITIAAPAAYLRP